MDAELEVDAAASHRRVTPPRLSARVSPPPCRSAAASLRRRVTPPTPRPSL
jgi:hypothetical protein